MSENKRFRAGQRGTYYVVSSFGKAYCKTDYGLDIDDASFELGNYFETEEEAESLVESFRKILKEHHENKGLKK